MTEQNEISLLEEISHDRAPEIYGQGGLQEYVDQVRAQVAGEVPDLETDKGRKRIASLAAKVSRSKTAVEKPGREYLKRIKALPRKIEVELREFTQEMDALRDEVRRPLTEFEEKEKARIERHRSGLEWLSGLTRNDNVLSGLLTLEELKDRIAEAEATTIDESWEEFEAEAHRVKDKALQSLRHSLESGEKEAAERRELEELRRQQEEQRRKDEIAAAEKAAEERARQQAIEEAKAKEAAAKAEAERREREHQLAIERAEREKAEAEARAAQATENERKRYEADRLAEQQEQEHRERNKRHRGEVNRNAVADLVTAGLSEADAKTAVTAIAKGTIRGASINY